MSSPFIVQVKDESQLLHKKVQVFADPLPAAKFEPLFEMAVSKMMWDKTLDQKALAAQVSRHMGKTVAKMVESAVYNALTGSSVAADLNKIIHDQMLKKIADSSQLLSPDVYKDIVFGVDPGVPEGSFFVASKSDPLPWSSQASSPWDDIKDFYGKVMTQGTWSGGGVHPSLAALEKAIPGFKEMCQACPVDGCASANASTWKSPETRLHRTIIHLNDHHKWTREAIADWLDTLDHDLQFKTPEEVNNGNGN